MGLISATGGFVTGFVTGFGTGYLAHDRMPELRSIAAPAVKLFLRSGIRAMERSREGMTQLAEVLQDLIAEVQHELKFKPRRGTKKPHRASHRARVAPAPEAAPEAA